MKFEIIKWAKEKGLENFVLGGGYGADDGSFQYKMNLAPHGIRDFYIGRNVFDENVYRELLSIRNKGNKDMEDKLIHTGFFPAYGGGIRRIVYYLHPLSLWNILCSEERKENANV